MLVLLFNTIEDAINKLSIIKDQLLNLREHYGLIKERMKENAETEERLVRLVFSHPTV